MKVTKVASYGVGASLICILLMAWLVGCDVVTHTYPTLADAKKAGLFERGWLPDLLPLSAANIRTSNDLDINTSEGRFDLSPADMALFKTRLQPGFPEKSRFANWSKSMEGVSRRSDWVAQYRDGETIWVFNCTARMSSCEYLMWVEQKPAQ